MTKLISSMLVLVGACEIAVPVADPASEPATATQTSAIVSQTGQGTRFQGTRFQDTRFQGTRFQGTRFQGTRFQGASLGGVSLGGGAFAGSALWVWEQLLDRTWKQRLPHGFCLWNEARTVRTSCTNINLATTPSPLAGVTFPGEFVDSSTPPVTFTATLQIGASSSATSAIARDTDLSMFALNGSTTAAGCVLVPQGPSCSNPGGCRTNCDIFTYDIRLIEANGAQISLCGPGESALALAGTWDVNGQHAADPDQFTFACTGGTIAKCARWGYRPWDAALMSDGATRRLLAPYHQACVRAAAAAYCGTALSFTQDGTLVDIYDWNTSDPLYFVPRTTSAPGGGPLSALLWESTFDGHGATQIDHARYANLPAISDPYHACPGMFVGGGDTCGGTTNDCLNRNSGPWGPELVSIKSATACTHGEATPGIWLDQACSTCTNRVAYSDSVMQSGVPHYPHLYCSEPTGTWDSGCVAQASSLCGPQVPPMTSHSECSVGTGLGAYSTGCTLLLNALAALHPQDPAYNRYASCGSSWTQTCVDGAHALCTGGQEVINSDGVRTIGFCGLSIPSVPR